MTDGVLRAGIIGAGNIAWRYDGGRWTGDRSVTHAACLERHPRTSLVAVLEPDPAARAAVDEALRDGPAPLVTDDPGRFYGAGLDLVSICAPHAVHGACIRDALAAGARYLWIEKPVTLDLDEYRSLIALMAEDRDAPRTTVNYFRRSLPQFKQLRDACRAEGLVSLDLVYSRGLETNGVHLLDMLGFLLDLAEQPTLDWLVDGPEGNPSFGTRIGEVGVTVRGMALPYHCIECRATFASGRFSMLAGGMRFEHEARIENPDFPGFFLLGPPSPAIDQARTAAAMLDGTYLNLCELVDDTLAPASTIRTAYFAQALLDNVQRALAK